MTSNNRIKSSSFSCNVDSNLVDTTPNLVWSEMFSSKSRVLASNSLDNCASLPSSCVRTASSSSCAGRDEGSSSTGPYLDAFCPQPLTAHDAALVAAEAAPAAELVLVQEARNARIRSRLRCNASTISSCPDVDERFRSSAMVSGTVVLVRLVVVVIALMRFIFIRKKRAASTQK